MEGSTRYATFFIIFTLVYTYFSYALAFSVVPQNRWDTTLDLEEIFASGILLGERDDLNISYGGVGTNWHYFNVNNTEIRVEWSWIVTIGDHFRLQTHVSFFGVELAWMEMSINDYGNAIYNSSVIVEWNNQTKWSMFKCKNGYYLFFSDPLKEHNITRAIYEDGNVTLTIAESISFDDDVNMMTFISWYTGMITGTKSYGLPSIFNVILQAISVLSLLSVIILAKDLIS